jgi:hypothetical protein
MVCTERTIGWEIILWMDPMVLRDVGQVEAHFNPVGDSVNLDTRWYTVCAEHAIGSEIILRTANGTPR